MRYGKSFRTKEWLVPKLICKSSLRLQSSFLQGFFDSEGDVDKNSRRIGGTSSNLEGLKNIESLLHNFGIRTSITKQSKKFIYTLRIQDRKSVEIFNKYIGFTITRKQKILKQLVGSYSLWKSIPEEVKKLKSEMIILRRQGLSYNEISNKLNLSAATVWNHLNKYQDKYLFPRDPERLLP
jgi:intein-encoded DNA endonuclease-like protein